MKRTGRLAGWKVDGHEVAELQIVPRCSGRIRLKDGDLKSLGELWHRRAPPLFFRPALAKTQKAATLLYPMSSIKATQLYEGLESSEVPEYKRE